MNMVKTGIVAEGTTPPADDTKAGDSPTRRFASSAEKLAKATEQAAAEESKPRKDRAPTRTFRMNVHELT